MDHLSERCAHRPPKHKIHSTKPWSLLARGAVTIIQTTLVDQSVRTILLQQMMLPAWVEERAAKRHIEVRTVDTVTQAEHKIPGHTTLESMAPHHNLHCPNSASLLRPK